MSSFPVLFVTGSHYDLGYEVGCSFKEKIQTHIKQYQALKYYQEYYETDEGRRYCNGYIDRCTARFPQYMKELQGWADGSAVPLADLCLCNMERELDFMVSKKEDMYNFKYEKGCSDIVVNNGHTLAWGHNEDFYPVTQTFLVCADIEPFTADDGRVYQPEKFTSQAYVHSLPGQSYGFNYHGLVYSVDYLYPSEVDEKGTAENFLTRSMLAATNIDDLKRILKDDDAGCSAGICVHAAMLGSDTIHNMEIAPNKTAKGSLIQSSLTWNGKESDRFLANFNKYKLIDNAEDRDNSCIASSRGREERMSQLPAATTVEEILQILGDEVGDPYRIYRKDHFPQDSGVTINTVLFDLKKQSFSLWHLTNPKRSKPVLTLPLTLHNQL